MKNFFLIFTFFILPLIISAQNVNGRISSSVYSFERFDVNDQSETYFRTYQTLNLNVNKNQFSLKTRFNLASNISNQLVNDPRLRFYNLYVEGRNLYDIATIKIGRQPIYNFVAGGLFDGINLKFDTDYFTLSGFYGGNVPAYQKLELIDEWSDNTITGGKLAITALEDFRFAFSYINKNFKRQSYEAIRLDENLNPMTVLIEQNSNQFKFLSGEASYTMENYFNISTRYDYDLNFETTSRFEIDGRYDQIKDLGINLYYNYREPRIQYNSIFSVFNYANSQEIEGGIDYKINPLITVVGKFANVTYDNDDSQRFTIGLNSNYGSVSYRKNLGYAGELDAVSIYTAHSFLNGMITPSAGISFSNYKLSEEDDKNNITSVLAGFNYRPLRVLSFDLQGQYFNNKIYKNDFRVLFKLNYWFNTNLDLI